MILILDGLRPCTIDGSAQLPSKLFWKSKKKRFKIMLETEYAEPIPDSLIINVLLTQRPVEIGCDATLHFSKARVRKCLVLGI